MIIIGWILYTMTAPTWVWVVFGVGVVIRLVKAGYDIAKG